MGGRAGGGASGGMGSRSRGGGGGGFIPNTPQGIQSVKNSILSYSKTDKWNKNTDYRMGFNDEVQGAIEQLAKGNYGFPSQVAQTITSKPSWNKSGAYVSEKQAYHIAKGLVDNKLVKNTGAFFSSQFPKA